jgi:hypothetical protein
LVYEEKSKHVHFRSAKMVLYTLFSEKMIFPTIFTQLSQQNDFPHHFLHSFLSKISQPPFLQSLLLLVKGTAKPNTYFGEKKSVMNMI